MRKFKSGPGIFIAAAFIGPGTVTVCTLAGVSFGFDLLWVLLFAFLATLTLQGMATRLGTISGKGLGEAIRDGLTLAWLKYALLGLVFSAIVIGNAAYEAGNLGGAALGLEVFMPWKVMEWGEVRVRPLPLLIGFLSILLVIKGSYEVFKRVLLAAVLLMSIAFILSAIATKPSLGALFSGWVPKLPDGSLLLAISLVGTTIVPYNLFLHASLSKARWKGEADLKGAKRDTFIYIAIGILISASVLITAAFSRGQSIENAADMAIGLEMIFGQWATILVGIGLFAAGLSSAITAPLAAAYVASEIFKWDRQMEDPRFKWVAIGIIAVGTFFAGMDIKPILLIQFAQAANGFLLPIMAILLLWVMNNKWIMKSHRNSTFQNLVAIFVIAISIILGGKALWSLFN